MVETRVAGAQSLRQSGYYKIAKQAELLTLMFNCIVHFQLHIYFLFFKVKFIYFNWRLITLQYCIGFAIHHHESATGVHVFPILKPPTHLPPRIFPLCHPSTPAPSILYPASNLDGRFISYMVLYLFQCHSPKSSHPLSPTESKRLFYISVSLLLSRIQGYHYHLSKFHIYVLVYCIGVFISGLLHSV